MAGPRAGEVAQLEPGHGALKCLKIPTPGFIGIIDGALGEQDEYFPKSQGQIIPCALMGPPPASFQGSEGFPGTL